MPRGPGHVYNSIEVSQDRLFGYIARDPNCIRVGATNDPHRRVSQYEQEGTSRGWYFRGNFFYTRVRNCRLAEDNLLQIASRYGGARLNQQLISNYHDAPGYVYAIVGVPVRMTQMANRGRGRMGPPRGYMYPNPNNMPLIDDRAYSTGCSLM